MYFVFKTVFIIWRKLSPYTLETRAYSQVMLPATRGAEVLYHNVLRPVLAQNKGRATGAAGTNPFKQSEGFNMAGTTAPSSFEREPARSCSLTAACAAVLPASNSCGISCEEPYADLLRADEKTL